MNVTFAIVPSRHEALGVSGFELQVSIGGAGPLREFYGSREEAEKRQAVLAKRKLPPNVGLSRFNGIVAPTNVDQFFRR